MKSKTHQSGFAHIVVIVVIALILVIGLVGYRVSQNKDKPVAINTPKITNSTQSKENTSLANSSDKTKFLTIKEWGVKFALTTATLDAYYDTKTGSPIDSMSLRSHALDSEAECRDKAQSVASIFRVAVDEIDDQTSEKYSETYDGQTVGDHYYFIQSSQYLCTENLEKSVILQAIRNSFNTSGSTIVKS